MADESHVIDKAWDALPNYAERDGDDAVTLSISTAPGEWLVNTTDAVVVPMSMVEVVEALRAGKLTERSLVWRQGMQEWSCVDAVPQLKLAARLPERGPPAAPTAAVTSDRSSPSSASSARPSPTPPRGLSRRSTLPFGIPSPITSLVRPTPAQAILPESDAGDDSDVLAVYARPAATISFDLSPEQPLRAPIAPAQTVTPPTLAPTTSDSAPRPARAAQADLSVVAAADYRAVQRSGKRLVLVWSMASAAAASLLTFWLSRSTPISSSVAAASPTRALAATPPQPAPIAIATIPPAISARDDATTAVPSSRSDLERAPAEPPPAKARAKAARKRRAPIKAAPSVSAPPAELTAVSSEGQEAKTPSAEPNPYEAKPETETAVTAEREGAEAPNPGSTSPGF